ncbi:hypothetical protein NDG61_003910 [Salmonella enterica]|nr:hypothetical protein [Salmonella enterica]
MPRNESTQITIGNDWTQITDGNTDEVIQFYTVVDICRSPQKPANEAAALRFNTGLLTFTAPDTVWIRTVYEKESILTFY